MKRVWNKFLVYFVNGVLILLPVLVTITLIRFLMLQLNNIILEPIVKIVKFIGYMPQHHIIVAKTIVFFTAIFVVAFIGWGAKVIFINRIFLLGEKVLIKVPFMGWVYNAAKQIFSAFLGHGNTAFKQVVLVEYPRKGMYSIGFTSGATKGELKSCLTGEGMNVYVPTSPNPTTGMFVIVPKEEVCFLNMSIENGMKLIVSGGSVSLPDADEKAK